MSKTLYTLCVSYAGKSTPLYFETYEGLLASRAHIIGLGLEGLTVDEDEATVRLLFSSPETSGAYVRLWTESLGAIHTREQPTAPPPAAEPVLSSGLTHKEEVLNMLLRDGGVTLDQIVERYGILRDSASAIISTTCSKFGYTSHRSDAGVYTATKGRADGRGMKQAAATKTKAASEVHVLGRGRRVAESRAH